MYKIDILLAQGGLVEPLQLLVDLLKGGEGDTVPELPGEDRVVALYGGLGKGLPGYSEYGIHLVLQKEVHGLRDVPLPRCTAYYCQCVVYLHAIGSFELLEERGTFPYEVRCRLPLYPPEVPQARFLFEGETDEVDGLRSPRYVLLSDEVSLHHPLSQTGVDGMFGIAQIPRGALSFDPWLLYRKAQIRHDLSDGAQGRKGGPGILHSPLLGDSGGSRVELAWIFFEMAMDLTYRSLHRGIPLSSYALCPSAHIRGAILVR